MPGTELTIDRPLTAPGRTALRAAAGLYIKHLQSLAKQTKELGKERESAQLQREADTLKVDLLGPDEDPTLGRLAPHPGPLVLTAAQTKALGKGLEFWLHNLRAAKGTMRGLGKDALAEQFEEEAVDVEAHLVPMFQDQQSLPLTPADAQTDEELADQAAERLERQGVHPIGTRKTTKAGVAK